MIWHNLIWANIFLRKKCLFRTFFMFRVFGFSLHNIFLKRHIQVEPIVYFFLATPSTFPPNNIFFIIQYFILALNSQKQFGQFLSITNYAKLHCSNTLAKCTAAIKKRIFFSSNLLHRLERHTQEITVSSCYINSEIDLVSFRLYLWGYWLLCGLISNVQDVLWLPSTSTWPPTIVMFKYLFVLITQPIN